MSFITTWIQDQVLHQNKNFLMVITGQTGSGKSYSAMRFAELIDPTFNIDRVVFTQEQFTDLLQNGNLKKGNVIVWDEVGVNQSAKEWFETTNKLINFVIQTFRNKNLVIICTAPNFNFVDSTTRDLFHAYVRCQRDNNGMVKARFYNIEVNDLMRKIYYKKLRHNGDVVDYLNVSKPTDALCEAYEKKAEFYKDTVILKAHAGVKSFNRREEMKGIDANTIATQVLKDYERFRKPWGKRYRIDSGLIEAYFSIGGRLSNRVKRITENELGQRGLLARKT